MQITRKQVARRAEVSEATVSYVVNNGPRNVAPETRERVLTAIQELGYYPSDVARSLRIQRTSTIGLVLPDTANPYYGELARNIESRCYQQGFTVLLCNSNLDPDRERDYVFMLRNKRVEGIVFIPTGIDSAAIRDVIESRIPTVILDYEVPGLPSIVVDEFSGGYQAAQHLLALGHTRFACVTRANDTSSSRSRSAGFLAALGDAGFAQDSTLLYEAGPDIADGEAAALAILSRPDRLTAMFAHDDSIALGVMRGVYRSGLSIPRDISVVGFDNIAESAYFYPPLTTIANSKQRMGEEAARLLLRFMTGEGPPPEPSITVLDVQLVERESTGPAANSTGGAA